MKVPFWSPARNYLSLEKEIDQAIKRVLLSGQLVLGYGKDVELFEKNFAKFIGVKHAIMCGAGTQALYLAYRGLGIGQGDEVITTSHTFIATIDQIVALGAKPILVDIDDTGLIDPKEIEKAITKKTKAIVPVHLEGKMCDMPAIMKIAKKHKLLVIEDAAQAAGANIDGKVAGSWGHAGCFSLFPAKTLGSFGNAGCVTTNDDKLAERLKMMRCNWNIGKNPSQDVEFGVNMEPDVLQAVVLNVKLKKLKSYLKAREDIADFYYMNLKDLPILLPYRQNGRIYQDFVIRVEHGRGELIKHLQKNGVGILGHNLTPNHLYKKLGLKFKLPKTEKYIATQIRIPCSPDHTNEEISYVVKVIKSFYEKN
jgi:dTDP-4-amino-4,6-dideoxygalactose transaminase